MKSLEKLFKKSLVDGELAIIKGAQGSTTFEEKTIDKINCQDTIIHREGRKEELIRWEAEQEGYLN